MILNGSDVMYMLRPNGGWAIIGEDYDTLIIEEGRCEPVTKEEFETGFVDYPTWKAEQDSAKAAQKAALLDRLGINEDEAKMLLA
jgi:hypothetical protein